jgi:hypothetical protein
VSAPDLTQKVIGYRQWTVDDEGFLTSIGVTGAWGRGTNVARCQPQSMWLSALEKPRKSCDDSPGPACSCGIYAYHQMHSDWLTEPPWSGTAHLMVGAIVAWGRMEVHKDGFRAQYAEPVALAYHPSFPLSRVERVGQ